MPKKIKSSIRLGEENIIVYDFEYLKGIIHKRHSPFIVPRLLSLNGNPEDTIYVGISKTAKIKNIEKTLLPAIEKHLKPPPTYRI